MKKAHKFKRIFAGVVLAMTLVNTAVCGTERGALQC